MYYVYILYSRQHKRTYVGQSCDIEKRLKEHNGGNVKSTKPYIPYEIIYEEKHETRQLALKREKYFKTYSGRQALKKI